MFIHDAEGCGRGKQDRCSDETAAFVSKKIKIPFQFPVKNK